MASKCIETVKRSLRTTSAVNKELIRNIKLHPRLWHAMKYTQKDEKYWDSISAEMGIQKSWLKRRWHHLRVQRANMNRNTDDDTEEFVITLKHLDDNDDDELYFATDEEYEYTFVTEDKSKSVYKTQSIEIEKVDESATEPKAKITIQNGEKNEMEYEDKVFGDFVAAILTKMSQDKKKQAKKDIMNILL